jgi:hypothetical protein
MGWSCGTLKSIKAEFGTLKVGNFLNENVKQQSLNQTMLCFDVLILSKSLVPVQFSRIWRAAGSH